jgi:cytochrome c5
MKSLALALLMLTACTDGGGPPSGALCPPTDPPTYANFGQQFFATYCTSCHSASSTNRHGAPGQNYDTEADIKRYATDIDAWAAAGPDGANTRMPKLGGSVTSRPSLDDRTKLGVFLACELGR